MQQKQIISIKIKNQKKKSTVIITIIKKLGSFSKCNKRKNLTYVNIKTHTKKQNQCDFMVRKRTRC